MIQEKPSDMNKKGLLALFFLVLVFVVRCYRYTSEQPEFVFLPPLEEAPPLQEDTCDSQNVKTSLGKLLLGGGRLEGRGGESILIINTRDNKPIYAGLISNQIDLASIEPRVNTFAPASLDSPYSVPYTVLYACTVQASTSVEGGKIIARQTVDYEVVEDEEGDSYVRIGKKGFSPAKGTPRPN
jgi:hypothetical protein